MINKTQVIDAIQQVNQSARRDWLNRFAAPALRRYLDHLQLTLEPRGRTSIWVRPGDTHALTTREPAR